MNSQSTHRLPDPHLILTINGGSSSIKFALFEPGERDSLLRFFLEAPRNVAQEAGGQDS